MNTTRTPPTDPTAVPTAVDPPTLSQLMDGEWHDVDRSACVAAVCADERLKACWARWHLARDAMRGEPVPPGPASLAARISAAVAEEPAYSNVTALPGAAAAAPSAAAPGPAPGLAPGPAPGAARAAGLGPVGLGAAGFGLAAGVALATLVGLDAWRGGIGDAPAEAGTRVAAASSAASVPAGRDPVAAALRVDDDFGASLSPLALPEVDLVSNTAATTGSYWVAGDSGARRGAAERRLNAFLSQHLEHSPGAARQGMLPYSRLVGYDELPAGTPAAGR